MRHHIDAARQYIYSVLLQFRDNRLPWANVRMQDANNLTHGHRIIHYRYTTVYDSGHTIVVPAVLFSRQRRRTSYRYTGPLDGTKVCNSS